MCSTVGAAPHRSNTSFDVAPRGRDNGRLRRSFWIASCNTSAQVTEPGFRLSLATQKIFRIRRDYNGWVANESLEDYALRYTPRHFRKWSEFRVANTAFGATSFLALEAIGGAIALSYGFTNALWAILMVGLITFLTGLPISYYAAKYGLDMD